jgi:uncharacterized membrane protein (UPF0127 family)
VIAGLIPVRRGALLSAVAASMLAVIPPQTTADETIALPQRELRAGNRPFSVAVAATPQQRQRGLMGYTHLGDDEGMLFVFENKSGYCFWMQDTLIPLSIAFLDDDGSIVNIEDMRPRTPAMHCPKSAVRYALEMNQGWFRNKDLRPGMKINGLPR